MLGVGGTVDWQNVITGYGCRLDEVNQCFVCVSPVDIPQLDRNSVAVPEN